MLPIYVEYNIYLLNIKMFKQMQWEPSYLTPKPPNLPETVEDQ